MLNRERDQLVAEKKEIEGELALLASTKKTEMARVYRGSRNTVVGTCEVAARYDKRRYDLITRKKACEDRLSQVNAKLGAMPREKRPQTDEAVILLRIEAVLLRILEKVSSSS
jgi:hypothetical protein